MFKKRLLFLIVVLFYGLFQSGLRQVSAISDPLSVPNNKVGIHILDPNEVEKVSDLVNSNNGEWGYVTVPIRDDDKDRIKWQKFMDRCLELKLIPIIRLATIMKPGGWESPTLYRSLDFANFLNDLSWPVKNRYIVVYNEPNHATEWDGWVDPAGYAVILKYTSQIFKVRNEDFFILPAGLDAAAPDGNDHLSIYNFMSQMVSKEPDVFEYIDGWNSHSYPNPAFAGSPYDKHDHSIISYKHEIDFLKRFVAKDLPVFITETGWKDNVVGQQRAAIFYKTAFEEIWLIDKRIVAITPFLFLAGEGPFAPFSFLQTNGEFKPSYNTIRDISKTKGEPKQDNLMLAILGSKTYTKEENFVERKTQFFLSKEKWQKILDWFMVY